MSLVGNTRRWVVLAWLGAVVTPASAQGVSRWEPVDARSVPTSRVHRVTVERGSGDRVRTAELEGPPVPVTAEPTVIGRGVRVPTGA